MLVWLGSIRLLFLRWILVHESSCLIASSDVFVWVGLTSFQRLTFWCHRVLQVLVWPVLFSSHIAKVTLIGFGPLKWRQVLWDEWFGVVRCFVSDWHHFDVGTVWVFIQSHQVFVCYKPCWRCQIASEAMSLALISQSCVSQLFGTWVHWWRRVLVLWHCRKNQKPRLDFSSWCLTSFEVHRIRHHAAEYLTFIPSLFFELASISVVTRYAFADSVVRTYSKTAFIN